VNIEGSSVQGHTAFVLYLNLITCVSHFGILLPCLKNSIRLVSRLFSMSLVKVNGP